MFEGVAIMQLRDGKIAEYHEVANTAPALVGHQVRAGADCEDYCETGRGAKSTVGDEAAFGVEAFSCTFSAVIARSTARPYGGDSKSSSACAAPAPPPST